MSTTQYRDEDGIFTTSRSAAHHVAPDDIVRAWLAASSLISPRFALGTALHETNYIVNERSAGDQGDGSDSDGIYQLSRSEAIRAGHPAADLFDLEEATTVFAILMERNLEEIQSLAPDNAGSPDVRAYLSISHNQGMQAVRDTIKQHGLDWAGYVARNKGISKPGFNGAAIVAYGNDVISGGPDYRPEWDALAPTGHATDPLSVGKLIVGVGIGYGLTRLLAELFTRRGR